jgi:hypothetical protein
MEKLQATGRSRNRPSGAPDAIFLRRQRRIGPLVTMAGFSIPELDDELRRRLGRRYGNAIDALFDPLPDVLSDLAERWAVECESLWRRLQSLGRSVA